MTGSLSAPRPVRTTTDPHLPPAAQSPSRPEHEDPLSAIAVRHLASAEALRSTAWELAAAGLRAFRPELSEADVQDEVRRLFRRAAG